MTAVKRPKILCHCTRAKDGVQLQLQVGQSLFGRSLRRESVAVNPMLVERSEAGLGLHRHSLLLLTFKVMGKQWTAIAKARAHLPMTRCTLFEELPRNHRWLTRTQRLWMILHGQPVHGMEVQVSLMPKNRC